MTKNLEIQIMMKSKLFSNFSENECLYLYQTLRPVLKEFEDKTVILNENERIQWIGIVHMGKLMGMKFYMEGSANLYHNYTANDVINIAAAVSGFKTSPLTLITDKSTKIMMVPVEPIMQNKMNDKYRERLKDNILTLLADENIKLLYKTDVLSKKMLRDRIMTYLLIMREKRSSNSFHIMMNREQFAQYLCVNRSALSHELTKMRKDGLIFFEKDYFKILKLE